MRKVVINSCYGGFGISVEAADMLLAKGVKGVSFFDMGGEKIASIDDKLLSRDDKDLVEVVEKLGEKANGKHAKLKIVEIPLEVEWQIEEYDGIEWIAEKHRTWH